MSAPDKKGPDPGRLIDELEKRIDETHHRFDMYFHGIERTEPSWFRDDCKRRIKDLNKMHIVNTGLKFRFQNLKARFTLHETYWNRILKQIEEGTYKLHKMAAQKMIKEKEAQEAEKKAAAEATANGASSPKQTSTPQAGTVKQQAAPTAAKAGETPAGEQKTDQNRIYNDFIQTKKRLGESVDGITPQSLDALIKKRSEELQAKYGKRDIEFKVTEKNGKATLTAVIKK